MLGVEYAPEFLAYPRNHRYRSSIALRGPGGNVLVDCAPEMRLQLVRAGIRDLEAVIITHTHADHVMGMDDLRSLCIRKKSAMPVYTLPRYQEDIRRVYAYAFGEYPEGLFVPRFDLREVEPRMEVAGFEIETMCVEHGKVPVIALRVCGFAYVTDVSVIPPEAEARLQGLDTLMIDATRFAAHPNHLNLEGALEAIARLKPGRAFLTHLSHDYDAAHPPALPGNVELAFDGLRIDL